MTNDLRLELMGRLAGIMLVSNSLVERGKLHPCKWVYTFGRKFPHLRHPMFLPDKEAHKADFIFVHPETHQQLKVLLEQKENNDDTGQ